MRQRTKSKLSPESVRQEASLRLLRRLPPGPCPREANARGSILSICLLPHFQNLFPLSWRLLLY